MSALRPLSIDIAGAGNADPVVATALARQGHDVHVFEKHPQLTAMGAGLLVWPWGIRVLEAFGVGRELEDIGAPVDRLIGLSHRGWCLLDIDYAEAPGRTVTRHGLSSMPYDAGLHVGAAFHFGCAIQQLLVDGPRVRVTHVQGESISDLFVIADGAASALRKPAGLAGPSSTYRWGTLWFQGWVDGWNPRVLQQCFRGTREMMDLLPTEVNGNYMRLSMLWSLPGDAVDVWCQTDITQWKAHTLSLWPQAAPMVEQISSHDDMPFTAYRHTWPRALVKPPYCVIGDAAHTINPQLGLGTTLAAQDALALVACVQVHGPTHGALAYHTHHLRTVQAYQMLNRALIPCFQAQYGGWMRDVVFATGLRVPGVAWLTKRSLAEPLARDAAFAPAATSTSTSEEPQA